MKTTTCIVAFCMALLLMGAAPLPSAHTAQIRALSASSASSDDRQDGESASRFSPMTVLFFALILLAVFRSYRVSRKYRDRYLKPNIRKTKDHTRKIPEDDDLAGDGLHEIDDSSDDSV